MLSTATANRQVPFRYPVLTRQESPLRVTKNDVVGSCTPVAIGRTGEFLVQRNTMAGQEDRAIAIRGAGPLE